MLQLSILLLLLPVPKLEMLIVLLPDPIPTNVPVSPLPTTFRFWILLLVAPFEPRLCTHMTADAVPLLVLVMVRLWSAPFTPPMEPSMVTRSAAFKRINAPEVEPVIARGATVGYSLIVKLLPTGCSANSLRAFVPSSPARS